MKTGMMLGGVCTTVSSAGGVCIAVPCGLSYDAKRCVHRSALRAEHLFRAVQWVEGAVWENGEMSGDGSKVSSCERNSCEKEQARHGPLARGTCHLWWILVGTQCVARR